MGLNKLKNIDVKEKKVLLRTDYNVPIDENGAITDVKRINDSIPTLRYILDNGAAKVIILTHIGRPKDNEEKLKTDNVAEKLSEILTEKVAKVNDWGEEGLPEERIVMLENARFSPYEKSKDENERDSFAQKISKNADLFVMEAFSNMHRGKQASMTSTLKYLPACLGIAAEKEIETINKAILSPQRPLVSIIGGVKADKIEPLSNILNNADKVITGGALAFNILYSMGYNMGKSKIDHENLKNYEDKLHDIKKNDRLMLPKDAVVAQEFSENSDSKVVPVDCIADQEMALDIGPRTIEMYKKELDNAKTIIWNGPLGVFEFEKFSHGTKEIAEKISTLEALSIIGGGDSAAAINKLGLQEKVSFVSSGGGASLMMFEGKKLPVLEEMEKNYEKFSL